MSELLEPWIFACHHQSLNRLSKQILMMKGDEGSLIL